MIELILASLITCEGAYELIENVNKSQVEYRQEIIEVIKSNSKPHCFDGGELNEGSKISGRG